ncbi:MAG: YncE family protein [Thermoplasmatales archaeon]
MMKPISKNVDSAVSEVIGAVLVFAIFISIFTTVSSYYIPATQSASENNYQQATMSSLSDLASSITNPSLATGSIVSQNIPLGIQGGILAPPRTTSLTYSTTGMSGSINYGIGLSFAYTSNHPTNAILNKLLQTFPSETLKSPSAVVYDPLNSHIYVSGYGSNVIATIDITHNTVQSYTYGGYAPKFMDLNLGSGNIYVADQKALNATTYSYFTINEYSASSLNLKYSTQVTFGHGLSSNVTAFTVDSSNGNVYIAFQTLSGKVVQGSFLQEYSGGSLVLLKSISLPISTIITDLCSFNSGTSNELVATFSASINDNVHNPYFMAINPSTLSITNDTINFSSFFSTSALELLAGIPYVTLTSIYSTPSSNLLLFAFNITGQTGLSSTASILSYPGPGVAAIIGNPLKQSNNISAATEFYSTSGYILDPQYISYDSFANTYSATVSGYSTSGGGQYSLLFNFTESGLYRQVESSNMYAGAPGQITFAQNNGQSYYLTTSNLTDTIAKFSLNSQGSVVSYNTILTNFFNGPFASLYDSFNNLLYVTDYSSGYVSVLDPDTCALIGAISLGDGSFPTNLTFNPNNGTVYVVESQGHSVALINGAKLVSTISTGSSDPVDIAFDPHDNSTYLSLQVTGGAQFMNISSKGITSSIIFTGRAGSVAFDPSSGSNSTYGLVVSSSGYNIYDLSAGFVGQSLTGPSTSYKLTITFNSYSGMLYATSDQPAGRVYLYTESSGSFSPYSTPYLLAGSDSYSSVFDAANNLLYIDNSGSSNITIYDTVSNSYFSTIWIGSTPLSSAFDPENGYIFIPDYGFNKLSVIDGGFTIYNGKVGLLEKGNFNFAGSISTYGDTRFITPESFVLEDGGLFQNVSTSTSRMLSPIPFTVLNQSGSVYFSDISSSFTLGNGLTNASASSYSSTNLKVQVLNQQNYTFSRGSQFYITDVYGNRYSAVATAVFMEFFNLTMTTPYASLINSYLYAHYSGNGGQPANDWTFSGLPITFEQSGDTISISLNHPISITFVSIVTYNIGLLEV